LAAVSISHKDMELHVQNLKINMKTKIRTFLRVCLNTFRIKLKVMSDSIKISNFKH
jgi:hypothetical protein